MLRQAGQVVSRPLREAPLGPPQTGLWTSPRYHHFLHALARVTARTDTDDLRAQWHSPTVQRSRFRSGHDGLHYLSVMDNSLRYDKRKRRSLTLIC